MKTLLKYFAPWIAVGIFLCMFKNGWLAIIAYHLQILLWNYKEFPKLCMPKKKRWVIATLPSLIAGPLVYFLLPYITHTNINGWLNEYKLAGNSFLLMIPYFGIIHPILEQMHWAPLRNKSFVAHIFFAGYHVLVLKSLLNTPWLISCFIALLAVSFIWKYLTNQSHSLLPAICSHIFADLGIIIACYFFI